MVGPFEVAIVAIIASTGYQCWKLWAKKTEQSNQLIENQQAQLDALTARVQALEKIVTEESYDLNQAFKKL